MLRLCLCPFPGSQWNWCNLRIGTIAAFCVLSKHVTKNNNIYHEVTTCQTSLEQLKVYNIQEQDCHTYLKLCCPKKVIHTLPTEGFLIWTHLPLALTMASYLPIKFPPLEVDWSTRLLPWGGNGCILEPHVLLMHCTIVHFNTV